VRERDDAQV
jgi:hypothetical protein